MGTSPQQQPTPRHFRINPVEMVILCVVSLVFVNSVYDLFHDRHGFHPTALAPMAAKPTSEGRSPASTSPTFIHVSMECGVPIEQETTATKARLRGPLCSSKLADIRVVNNSNKFKATVFTDNGEGTFSTDYIPLNSGKNPLSVEFVLQDGKSLLQEILIHKN